MGCDNFVNKEIILVLVSKNGYIYIYIYIFIYVESMCDAPKPGGPLTTRQPAEYKWRSGYPTSL